MTNKEELTERVPESSRMWASASFVGVLIIIGLPLWWKTTEVYRVSLPYDKISSFSSLPHSFTTELTVLANDEPTASNIVGLIENAFKDSKFINLKIKKSIIPQKLREALDSLADNQDAVDEVASQFDLKAENTFYVVQRKPLFEKVWLAGEQIMFFRDATASNIIVEALKNWVYQLQILEGAQSEQGDAARRTRVPPGEALHITLSVVQPDPGRMKLDFNAEEAVEDYIGSFVDELSVLHNFTLKSQWLYMLDFDFRPKELGGSGGGGGWGVRQERLPLLLTALEGRAATHVSAQPALNLVLYAAPCRTSPLSLLDDNDKPIPSPPAFLSPKWGGVVLASPGPEDCARGAWAPPVTKLMGIYIAQLRTLLGFIDYEKIDGARLEALRSVSPRRWERAALLRTRTLEQLTSAQRTLQSLAQLLGEISNIVINDEVGASINSAVESIQRASRLMAEGRLVEAYQTSLKAFTAAETAFMEPSLLALLYFPDDQKYAIYIPLFLPIMFPVVLSLKNLLLWLRGKPLRKDKID